MNKCTERAQKNTLLAYAILANKTDLARSVLFATYYVQLYCYQLLRWEEAGYPPEYL